MNSSGGYGKAWGVLEMKLSIQNIESKQLNGWLRSAEFAVGGFMWVGFSKRQPNRLLCISSQYISLVDCDTGEIVECDADYDEENFVAISESLPDEVVDIYGQYGGSPIWQTVFGEEILIYIQKEEYAGKTVIRTKVTFQTLDENIILHNNYGFYTCSFSPCGNYLVFADDGGVTIFRRAIS